MDQEDRRVGNWQIGIYTRPWRQHDYRVAFDAIAEAGFEHVGLMSTDSENRLVVCAKSTLEEAQTAGQEAKARGLGIPSVYGGGIAVAQSVEAGVADLRHIIDCCEAAGATSVLMGGIGNADLYDAYYKAVAECCDYAADKGVGITLKPHGGLNATGPQLRDTIEMVGHPSFRVMYDPGNIFYYSQGELNPIDDAPAVDGIVAGMCVKDYEAPKNVLLTPGTGLVDFAKVMAVLRAGGFTGGPLVIECLADGDLPFLLEEARKARVFVEGLVA
jgi:sugar phosphate isomerase/epimerase